MHMPSIAAAIERATALLRRRPKIGLQDDAPATACWQEGMRIVTTHQNGTQVVTDMPTELGGGSCGVSPGWLFRAGLASCTATCIAMDAAIAGIELSDLQVRATSCSDTRGLLGMTEGNGEPVYSGPTNVQMRVRISAPGISPDTLKALVEGGQRKSPIAVAVQDIVRVDMLVDASST